jgi:Icc-related predicted phosphoesterase
MPSLAATILVASDVHGRIPMLLRAALEYQRSFGTVHAILVSGDLGVWPEDARLDKSTAKFARTVPDELGFRAFAPLFPPPEPPRADAAQHLQRARTALARVDRELKSPLYFVGGNHEDYEFLERCRAAATQPPVPVDANGRLLWIPHGSVVAIPTPVGPLRVAGLGGISAQEGGRNPDKYHPMALLDEDAALALMDQSSTQWDVLVTHDSARNFVHDGHGASAIDVLVEEARPTLHISGHYHTIREPKLYEAASDRASGMPRTLGVHVNTFQPDPADGLLRPNCLGVITIDEERTNRFEFVSAEFLRRFRARNWYSLE